MASGRPWLGIGWAPLKGGGVREPTPRGMPHPGCCDALCADSIRFAHALFGPIHTNPCGALPTGAGVPISIPSGVDMHSETGRDSRSGGYSLATAFRVPLHLHRFASVDGPPTGIFVSHLLRQNGPSGLVGHCRAHFLSALFVLITSACNSPELLFGGVPPPPLSNAALPLRPFLGLSSPAGC